VEQLDQLMQVTSPRAWIVLVALGLLILMAALWSVFGTITTTVEGRGVLMRQGGVLALKSPDSGFVTRILVGSGDRVEKGQELLHLGSGAAGVPDQVVVAPKAALVLRRIAREGDKVARDDTLLFLESQDEPLQARVFLPIGEGYQVRKGQTVHVIPALAKSNDAGFLLGKVLSAGKFPMTSEEMVRRLQNDELVKQLNRAGPCLQVLVELEADPQAAGGYKWSSPRGNALQLFSGTPCTALFIVGKQRPIHFVFADLSAVEGE
jgi:hypothetical protein